MSRSFPPVRLRVPAHERSYAAFARHIVKDEAPPPEPIDPQKRATDSTIACLQRIADELRQIQLDVNGHLPESVRLKLSRTVLASAEQVAIAHTMFSTWRTYGTLQTPRNKASRKRRFKP